MLGGFGEVLEAIIAKSENNQKQALLPTMGFWAFDWAHMLMPLRRSPGPVLGWLISCRWIAVWETQNFCCNPQGHFGPTSLGLSVPDRMREGILKSIPQPDVFMPFWAVMMLLWECEACSWSSLVFLIFFVWDSVVSSLLWPGLQWPADYNVK